MLDGPVSADPAFHCLDWVSPRASVSGPPSAGGCSHFSYAGLRCSWSPWPWACATVSYFVLRKLGLSGMESNKVGFVLLFPFECLRDLSNIFRVLFLRPGNSKLVLSWRTGRVLGCAVLGYARIFTTTYLFPPAGEIKCCLGPFLVGEFGTVSYLGKQGMRRLRAGSVETRMVMVTFLGLHLSPLPLPPPSSSSAGAPGVYASHDSRQLAPVLTLAWLTAWSLLCWRAWPLGCFSGSAG